MRIYATKDQMKEWNTYIEVVEKPFFETFGYDIHLWLCDCDDGEGMVLVAKLYEWVARWLYHNTNMPYFAKECLEAYYQSPIEPLPQHSPKKDLTNRFKVKPRNRPDLGNILFKKAYSRFIIFDCCDEHLGTMVYSTTQDRWESLEKDSVEDVLRTKTLQESMSKELYTYVGKSYKAMCRRLRKWIMPKGTTMLVMDEDYQFGYEIIYY